MQKENQPKEIKYFVRIANTDLVGSKSIYHALRKIKGVNFMFANAICSVANIAKDKKAGILSESEIKKIDEVLKNPLKSNLKSWLFNRKGDYDYSDLGIELQIENTNNGFISLQGYKHSPPKLYQTKSNELQNHLISYKNHTDKITVRLDALYHIENYDLPLDITYGYSSVEEKCNELGIKCKKPRSLSLNVIKEITSLKPDFIFSIYYRKIFPKLLLQIPKYECVNIHPSFLPNLRGPVPTAWSIIKGKKNLYLKKT